MTPDAKTVTPSMLTAHIDLSWPEAVALCAIAAALAYAVPKIVKLFLDWIE